MWRARSTNVWHNRVENRAELRKITHDRHMASDLLKDALLPDAALPNPAYAAVPHPDNSDDYFTLAECGMWVASRKRGLAGSAINISLSLVLLVTLYYSCAYVRFMVTGPRKARRPKAGCCFQEKLILFISSVSVGFCVCVKSHIEQRNMWNNLLLLLLVQCLICEICSLVKVTKMKGQIELMHGSLPTSLSGFLLTGHLEEFFFTTQANCSD